MVGGEGRRVSPGVLCLCQSMCTWLIREGWSLDGARQDPPQSVGGGPGARPERELELPSAPAHRPPELWETFRRRPRLCRRLHCCIAATGQAATTNTRTRLPRRTTPQTWPYANTHPPLQIAARNANPVQAVAPFNPRPLLQSLYVAHPPASMCSGRPVARHR
jgi:hypothetical protein